MTMLMQPVSWRHPLYPICPVHGGPVEEVWSTWNMTQPEPDRVTVSASCCGRVTHRVQLTHRQLTDLTMVYDGDRAILRALREANVTEDAPPIIREIGLWRLATAA